MRTLKFILLPLFGVLAALMAFRLAAPYEDTLSHAGMNSEDARALFTYGTKWGEVNRIAFGALLCGPFAVVLSLGRRSWIRVVLAGVLGAALGAVVNFVTDSSADLIGIALSGRSAQFGSLMAMFAWCFLVPIGIAVVLVLAQGVTAQRIRRALYSVRFTAIASFVVQIVGGMMAVQDGSGNVELRSQIPVWRMVEMAVGFAFGLTILWVDERVRVGTVRLLHGRNEYVDWSLDYAVNRIGSAEGSEIYVRGFAGVEPLHAAIVRQGDQFFLEAHAQTLLNGAAVARAPLQSQDVISVGTAQLVFRSNVAAGYRAVAPVAPIVPVAVQTPAYVEVKILRDAFGQEIPLAPGRYGVGRDQTNAICLFNDPSVSSVHAEIIATPANLIVADLGSATGTRVNGRPIYAATSLNRGDVLEIGASRFSYLR